MRRIFAAALAATVVLSGVAGAQTKVQLVSETKRAPLAVGYDLDGEVADPDQLITAALGVIVSATDYTASIVAQPDTCRLHAITISDTDMGVGEGAITVVGTDCLGYTRTCSWSAWTAADDDGVKTLVCTNGKGAYFKTVTSITTGTMTAAATNEYFLLGYTGNSATGWRMYGIPTTGPNGEHGVNPFGSIAVTLPITTAGVSSTTVTGVSVATAFTNVAAGDMLLLTVRDGLGNVGYYERIVVTRTSASEVVLDSAVTIPATGITFSYKKPYFSTDPLDQLWIPVEGWQTAAFTYSVDSNTDTGGVVALLECSPTTAGPGSWVTIDTLTTASAGTQVSTMTGLGPVDLTLAPFSYCRVGLSFGTGDDDDTGVEDINLGVSLSK